MILIPCEDALLTYDSEHFHMEIALPAQKKVRESQSDLFRVLQKNISTKNPFAPLLLSFRSVDDENNLSFQSFFNCHGFRD